jgi:hypothetical protein
VCARACVCVCVCVSLQEAQILSNLAMGVHGSSLRHLSSSSRQPLEVGHKHIYIGTSKQIPVSRSM